MPQAAKSKPDRAASLVPAVRHTVPWRVVRAKPLSGHRLKVSFADGTTGNVALGGFLNGPQIANTVFESLRDPAYFLQARVVLGAVQWPNGAELAPDAMYDAISQGGTWSPE